jgi:predicted dehydrogenase
VARKRARIGVVGNVPLEVPQKPFYEKELQLRMSTSYGPGRYDPIYEEGGVDYPLPYVRWTENRNLEAFLDLVAEAKVDVATMTTHRFPIDQVAEAYALVEGKRPEAGAPLGVLFEYPEADETAEAGPRAVETSRTEPKAGTAGIALIGAGTFARGVLLPIMKKDDRGRLVAVVTATGPGGERARRAYGFEYASTDYRKVLEDDAIDVATVVTPHDEHARMVVAALRARKHVFVEKPLCIDAEELEAVQAAWREAGRVLHVGFNRRFAPQVRAIADHFDGIREPLSLVYRVNAGYVPPEDPVHRQGGRIIGEGCHFIDTLVALTGSRVRRVGVATVRSQHTNLIDQDSVTITLEFEEGHLGTVHYFARGSKRVPKERLEVFGGERSAVLDDFRRLELSDGGARRRVRSLKQDKGHAEQWARFMRAVREGGEPPMPFEDIVHVTRLSLIATDAARDGGGRVDIA